MTYRLLDHTADIAIEIDAADEAGLFDALAKGLLHVLTDVPGCAEGTSHMDATVEGHDLGALLVAFGNEVLFLFEVETFLWSGAELLSIEDGEARIRIFGERFDPERHPIARPFKAVTHHDAVVTRLPAEGEAQPRWTAEIIVDL